MDKDRTYQDGSGRNDRGYTSCGQQQTEIGQIIRSAGGRRPDRQDQQPGPIAEWHTGADSLRDGDRAGR